MKADFHVHSTASDGRYSPAEVVRKAARIGLAVLALADHDTVDGVAPAIESARSFPRLKIVPAVELSTEFTQGEVHILGYFINYKSPELKARLEKFRNERVTRAQKMLAKLAALGIRLDWRRVQEIAGGGSVGRPHVAQALLERGYVSSMREAFDKYLAQGKPAYVEREKLTPVEAVSLVLQFGGLPVLAHPMTANDPDTLIIELKNSGLVGIEAYYGSYTSEETNYLVSLAEKHQLFTIGGSDYHGLDDSVEPPLGSILVPDEVVRQFIALGERQALKTYLR